MNVDYVIQIFYLTHPKNRHLEKKKQEALDYHSNGRKGKIEMNQQNRKLSKRFVVTYSLELLAGQN